MVYLSRNKLICMWHKNKWTWLLFHTTEKLFTICVALSTHFRPCIPLRMWWKLRSCSLENAYHFKGSADLSGGHLWDIHYRETVTALTVIACCWQWVPQVTLQFMQKIWEHRWHSLIYKHNTHNPEGINNALWSLYWFIVNWRKERQQTATIGWDKSDCTFQTNITPQLPFWP